MITSATVSYTHLDVYKRQATGSEMVCMGMDVYWVEVDMRKPWTLLLAKRPRPGEGLVICLSLIHI